MEILVLGNGFDLAHKLPTQYRDFLHFVEVIKLVVEGITLEKINLEKINLKVKQMIQDDIQNSNLPIDVWKDLVKENLWIDYFTENEGYIKENWIDFESEISKVIQNLDFELHGEGNKKKNIQDGVSQLSNDFLNKKYGEYTEHMQSIKYYLDNGKNNSEVITYKKIRDDLWRDLQKLIRALEVYLIEYVEKQDIQVKIPEIAGLTPDHILSFNYTNTYRKLYDNNITLKEDMYDFIHGKTDRNHTVQNCNIVLGIDEYLPKERRDKEIEFISFKKYYQRIYKETGSKYLNWVGEIKAKNKEYYQTIKEYQKMLEHNDGRIPERMDIKAVLQEVRKKRPKHHVYIFGHSLDITDKDILKSLICCDNVYTTIYYWNDDTHAQQVANLVKVIGQKELIKRTGGPSKTIEFIKQQSN